MKQVSNAVAFRKIVIQNITYPLMLGLISSALFVVLILYKVSISAKVEHTDQTISFINQTEKRLIDAETGLRGFALTGDIKFLQPFLNATNNLPEQFNQLHERLLDTPVQIQRLNNLNEKYQAWGTYAENVIELVKKSRHAAPDKIQQGDGKILMDEMRQLFSNLLQTEETIRTQRVTNTRNTTYFVLFFVVAFSLACSAILAFIGRRQLMQLSSTYEQSLVQQKEQNEYLKKEQWFKDIQTELSSRVVGEQKMLALCNAILNYLVPVLGANVGVLYTRSADEEYVRSGSFGLSTEDKKSTFRPGEGVIGQVALDRKILELRSGDAEPLIISTSLVDIVPRHFIISPIAVAKDVNAILELGFVESPDLRVKQLLMMVSESIALAVKSAKYRERLESLLKEVQTQSEELQAQQEELRVSNEELEEQARLLKETQARMEAQHAELEETNVQLEEQSRTLEQQKNALNEKNNELTSARDILANKAKELERASKYKSEFLANMSHELRTPLNSSLILAKLLADNKENNLTPQQVEFAEQIMRSGKDLLTLINDILDLSKVESGKLEIHPSQVAVDTLLESIERTFRPIAKEKNLEFQISKTNESSILLYTGSQRVEQILKNLLSNAFKFTQKGGVLLEILQEKDEVRFNVKDTGIGISPSQLDVIFEAFKQADGTTSRKYGGTGLGLSISKNLAQLLGGTIEVSSEASKGSTFSLILPIEYKNRIDEKVPTLEVVKQATEPEIEKASANIGNLKQNSVPVKDDRNNLTEKDRCILIIEDDVQFANILVTLSHDMKFKGVIASTAAEGLSLAKKLNPDAIALDVNLPDHSGLMVLDQLKQNPKTRHIPVHIISGQDFAEQAYQMGAAGYILKPIKQDELIAAFSNLRNKMNQSLKKVLLIEDDEVQRKAIFNLIADNAIDIASVGFGDEALSCLQEEHFDCIIMDLNLPDMSGFELLEKISQDEKLNYAPVIIYTGKDLTADEEAKLKRYSQSVIIKGAKSPERLLDEVTLFLHQVESKLAPERQKILEQLRHRDKILEGKSILIVDDDMRNVFALTAALEEKGAKISMARNGEEALKNLDSGIKADLILMDVMMPVMDGYETMKQIRTRAGFKKTPIIALTAKAMKDDKEKCIEAGANDYLTKPVDLEKLLSLIRVWMR